MDAQTCTDQPMPGKYSASGETDGHLGKKFADKKELHPIKTSEYVISQNLQGDPALNWWVPHVLNKRVIIILLVK